MQQKPAKRQVNSVRLLPAESELIKQAVNLGSRSACNRPSTSLKGGAFFFSGLGPWRGAILWAKLGKSQIDHAGDRDRRHLVLFQNIPGLAENFFDILGWRRQVHWPAGPANLRQGDRPRTLGSHLAFASQKPVEVNPSRSDLG